jgi:hypothetical protein
MARLSPQDISAIKASAQRLGLDPYSFGAILQQESGLNPNIWGGAGGNYFGLIQFGGPERKEAGLDPEKIKNKSYTIPEQLPAVERWLRGRGFETGMSAQKAYATILGGNPNADIYAKDSFGTSVASATEKLLPGGSLYKSSRGLLGEDNIDSPQNFNNAAQKNTTNTAVPDSMPSNQTEDKTKEKEKSFLSGYVDNLLASELNKLTRKNTRQPAGIIDPNAALNPTLDPLLFAQATGMGSGYLNPMQYLQGYIG